MFSLDCKLLASVHLGTISLFFISDRSPDNRLPWSQILGEKVTPLPVRHTQRMPYLLSAYQIAISNTQRFSPNIDTRHPRNPGRVDQSFVLSNKGSGVVAPRTQPGRTSNPGGENANIEAQEH